MMGRTVDALGQRYAGAGASGGQGVGNSNSRGTGAAGGMGRDGVVVLPAALGGNKITDRALANIVK